MIPNKSKKLNKMPRIEKIKAIKKWRNRVKAMIWHIDRDHRFY